MTIVIGISHAYAGCSSLLPIKGNGNLVNSEKTVSTFEKISCSGSAKVRFHVSEEYRVLVTVDENLDEYVEIFTKNNVLNIGTKSGYNCSFTKFLIDVYCPLLTSVSISGSGSFGGDKIVISTFASSVSGSGKIEGIIECDNFSANISGSGKISTFGSSSNANISISGSGSFNGNEFYTKNATVNISGSGKANVRVEGDLKANISGSGGINYIGEAQINSKVSGSGKITKM